MKKLILKLLKKHYLRSLTFHSGQLVKHVYGDEVFEVADMYYSKELVPVLFIRDRNSRIMGVDPLMYIEYKGSVNV